MSNVLTKLFSPRSSTGPMVLSVALHVFVVGAVLVGMKLDFFEPAEEVKETYVDLDYQTIEEPPLPVKEERQVTAPVTPPVDKVVDTSPRELQDEASEVKGTQEAKAPIPQQNNEPSVPYYKIKPKYPRAALVAGIEGWVMLEVDINEKGEVENVRVIDGEQRNMFQAEARRAVSLYKYKPFVDASGTPVRVTNHQVRVGFSLKEEDEGSSTQ
jgi:TonB family protein